MLSVLLFIYGVQPGVGDVLETPMQLLNYMLLAAINGGLIGAIRGNAVHGAREALGRHRCMP